jgi:hypothetical protein
MQKVLARGGFSAPISQQLEVVSKNKMKRIKRKCPTRTRR